MIQKEYAIVHFQGQSYPALKIIFEDKKEWLIGTSDLCGLIYDFSAHQFLSKEAEMFNSKFTAFTDKDDLYLPVEEVIEIVENLLNENG